MYTRRRRQFVSGQICLMLGVVVLLTLIDAFSLEAFFVISFIGLLFLNQLTAPVNVTPRWRRRLRWVTLCGLVLFGVLIGWRLLETLPFEVL